jgi:hypothetical protein
MHFIIMHNAFMTDESDRLKKARIDAKYRSAADAARRLGIPYPTYAGHENGTRGFDKEQARFYAKSFKVNVLWLVYNMGTAKGQSIEQMILALPSHHRREVEDFINYLTSKSIQAAE